LRYADLKFKTPFNVMAERILKSGTRPRDWVYIGSENAYNDVVNEGRIAIVNTIDKTIKQTIKNMR